MRKIFLLSILVILGINGYSQKNKRSTNSDFLNEFFNDLKLELQFKDTILINSFNEIDSFSIKSRDIVVRVYQLQKETLKSVYTDKEERNEVNKNFNYNVNFNQIRNTTFIIIPLDSVRSINGDKINRDKRIKEFIEKYKTQNYYIFSEPLLLRDKNYCIFNYEFGSFFIPNSDRKTTIYKKVDGRWKLWNVISSKQEFSMYNKLQ